MAFETGSSLPLGRSRNLHLDRRFRSKLDASDVVQLPKLNRFSEKPINDPGPLKNGWIVAAQGRLVLIG